LNIKSVVQLFIPVLFSIGISSFFLLPAIFEKNLITIDTMTQGYFNYIIHFATLNQLFISRFWGFGASLWGPIDDMAFSVGLIQWLIPLISIIFLTIKTFQKKTSLSNKVVPILSGPVILFFLVFLFSVFLTHNKSTFIWKTLPFMSFYQFPWRFLSIAIFASSFVAGSIVLLINHKFQKLALILISLTTIILNFSYFKEDIWFKNLTDSQKLSSEEVIKQSGAGLKDYWPKFGKNFPTTFAPNLPTIIQGEVDFIKYYKKSNYSEAYFSVSTPKATINLPIVHFPNWELYVDNQKIDYQINPDLGLIQFEINQGSHHYELFFKNTKIRLIANLISLISLSLIIVFGIKAKLKK